MSAGVSRETPAVPPEAVRIFGDQVAVAERYVRMLATDGIARGLIGPREAPRLWERHVLNCAVVTDLLPQGSTVCDVGSGAGLPGLPMAIRRPDLWVTLVEPLVRRARFLDEAVGALALGNVTVLRARAEQLHGQRHFSAVTSRAVAPLDRLLRWSLPLVAPWGSVLAMKGRSAADEVALVQSSLSGAGLGGADVLNLGEDQLVFPTTVVRVEVGSVALLRWPQRSESGRFRGRN